MKRLTRVAGAVLLALAIAITQVPPSFVRAIGSSGDFEKEGNTVYSYNGTASAVSVPAGTTRIASEAFSNQNQLVSVSFPASLEVIENGAFRSCTSLTDVVLPGGLTTLESGAFAKCDNIRSFRFNNVLSDLGAGVFSGDDRLSVLDLGSNPYFIMEDGALYNKDKTKLYCVLSGRKGKSFSIPDCVNEIDRYAFWGCDHLENVTLSSNLYEIPEFAFSNCENLKEISIPLSVRKISAKAFEDCISLTNVRIPASVTTIHETAFDGCRNLNIISDVGTAAYEFFRNFDMSQSDLMAYEDSVSENSPGSYYNGPGSFRVSSVSENDADMTGKDDEEDEELTKQLSDSFDKERPADVSKADVWEDYSDPDDNSMGQTRVVGNQAVIFPADFDAAAANDEDATEPMVRELNPAHLPIEEYPEAVDIINAESEGLIPRKAYYQNEEITDVGFSGDVRSIGDLAFARSTIKSAVLPEGLENIGYGAFYHCDDLKKVYIPDSVTDIAPEAFRNTPFLDEWISGRGGDYLTVGDGVLLAYRGNDAKVTIPSDVKKIAGGAFEGHNEIKEADIPDNVIEIGEGAFSGCENLSTIRLGHNLAKIADRAFSGCPVDNLHIPASVRFIGLGAFEGAVSPSVVFETADHLPMLSFEQTSTRLTNDAYRTKALGSIPTAVISQTAVLSKGSVLDEEQLGFRGMIVTAPSVSGTGEKTAVLLRSTGEPDEMGVVRIPDSVYIDGVPYVFTGASPQAFSVYAPNEAQAEGEAEPEAGEAAEGVKAVILPASMGSIGDYIPSLALDTGSLTIGDLPTEAEQEEEESGDDDDKVYVETVSLQSSYPNAGMITADPVDDDSYYRLYVTNDPDSETKLARAVTGRFGAPVTGQLNTVSLQMREKETNVPITNFGRRQVLVKIPVSDTLYDQQICAVSLKEDGSLDVHFGTKSEEDGLKYFSFATNHFSPYGIYAGIGDAAAMIAEETAKLKMKDVTPDTSDRFPLNIVAALFLGALGGILVLNVPGLLRRRKIQIRNK